SYSAIPHPPRSTLFPYTTLFRSAKARGDRDVGLRERPKQARDLLERETYPAVGNRKGHGDFGLADSGLADFSFADVGLADFGPAAAHRRDLERNAARVGEFDRIVDQVFERGAQPNGIADHQRRKLVRYFNLPLQSFRRRAAGERIAGVAGERAQLEQILAD